MSLFCIIAYDANESKKKREQHREAHLSYLRVLKQENRLIAAGPLMDSEGTNSNACGSMLIVEFNNKAAVESWFAKEPFNQASVYKEIQIRPYIDGMPFV